MRRPNLLFIYTDEQRWDTIGALGNPQIQTPNLDRLAAQSVCFERTYVTQPVCTPSRASLLTGLWPHSHGCTENNIPLSEGVPCLPEMIRPGQYATAHFGKWHLGDELFAQHGFEEWRSIEDEYGKYFTPGRDPNAHSDYHRFLVKQGQTPLNGCRFRRDEAARFPEELGKPAFLAREAAQFIRAHRRDPFILYVNFLEPHMPFFGPRDNQYDPSSIPLPVTFDLPPGPEHPLKARVFARAYRERGHSGMDLRSETGWRRLIANYWGLCSLVDTHVGTILRELESAGLMDDTIVVFTSDHGDMMGNHQLLAKCVMFEEAVRVPLMIRLPGGRSRRIRSRFSQIDLVPTLLDLMGQSVPGHLQGCSWRSCLESGTAPEPDVFLEWNGPNSGIAGDVIGHTGFEKSLPDWLTDLGTRDELVRAIRDPVRSVVTPDGWKFNWSQTGQSELYNLNEDPYETRNLADRPEHASRQGLCRDRILRWQAQTRDTEVLRKRET